MVQKIEIQEYLNDYLSLALIDVRSPGEYIKGKIPGAINIPLFSNEERAEVGTAYKKKSREKAIELGLIYVKPKLDDFILQANQIANNAKFIVYCARGGMRSYSFAEHLANHGFKEVYVIKQGYKAFRNYALNTFTKESQIRILGGYTGSGKTYVLKYLKEQGEQIIDLEGLASHKGSAFGGIENGMQPTIEQFENNLFWEWKELNLSKPIWIEDESHRIGSVNIPMKLFDLMRNKPVYFLDIPKTERAKHLVEEYADCNKVALTNSIKRISKKMGGLNVKLALENLEQNNFYEVAICLLEYYDKYYNRGLLKRNQDLVHTLKLKEVNNIENTQSLLNYYEKVRDVLS
jgi:tRNA 2-selenouridine synthase